MAKPAGRLSPANWRGKQDVRLSDKRISPFASEVGGCEVKNRKF